MILHSTDPTVVPDVHPAICNNPLVLTSISMHHHLHVTEKLITWIIIIVRGGFPEKYREREREREENGKYIKMSKKSRINLGENVQKNTNGKLYPE